MKKLVYKLALGVFLIPSIAFSQKARLQIIHKSEDAIADTDDIYVNGALLHNDVPFRAATAFENVPAGVTLNVGIAPGESSSVLDTVANFPVVITTNETYVVVADGIVSSTGYSPAQPFGLAVYRIGRESPTNPNNTDVLVHHGATDAPTVDVYETGVGAGRIVDNTSYGECNSTGDLECNNGRLYIRSKRRNRSSNSCNVFSTNINIKFRWSSISSCSSRVLKSGKQ